MDKINNGDIHCTSIHWSIGFLLGQLKVDDKSNETKAIKIVETKKKL